MNLLSIVLYSHDGERRDVDFRPGELNIVTGWSLAGKSTLLDIVEFCLGRKTMRLPNGPIADTVAWCAVLLQLPGTRAFVARPSPDPGRSTTQRAMLEFGSGLQPLPFEELRVNSDTATVRTQIGRLIGIDENRRDPVPGSLRAPLTANLGHAVWFCLQSQGETANRDRLFHRQGDPGIDDAIRDTLPYFLGAVPQDQAQLRHSLLEAKRSLRRAQNELAAAQTAANELETDLRSLLAEARARRLIETDHFASNDEAVDALKTALDAALVVDDYGGAEEAQAGHRLELERERDQLRTVLREIAEHRALLTEQAKDEGEYARAVSSGASRLSSLSLADGGTGSASHCPICSSPLAEPDPTVAEMQASLNSLRGQLRAVQTSRPRRTTALSELEASASQARERLRAVDTSLAALRATPSESGSSVQLAQQQSFTKGRIHHYLQKLRTTSSEAALNRLREHAIDAERIVDDLSAELDPAEELEQVASRLLAIGQDMTEWANRLRLEHRGRSIRIDLRRLTVVADTASGPAYMYQIGSAENHVGFHLVAHLALHRYFVNERRPVPHFLMIDQPSQAFYPSDIDDGLLADDDDRAVVQRMYELMRDVVAELAPAMQIIVCDHANLKEPWFQESVRHNWRNGDALIPRSWIERWQQVNG